MRKPISRLLALALLAGLGLAAWLLYYASTPMGETGVAYPLAFSIERGATLKKASQDLRAAGALNPLGFRPHRAHPRPGG